MAERQYERQIIRFGNRGVNLSVPPELVPIDQYYRFDNAVCLQDGILTSAPGGLALFTAGNTHSIIRLSRHSDGRTFFIVGFGTEIQAAVEAGGFFAAVDTGFSGNPLTFVNYKTPLTSQPFIYVGDVNKNIKIEATPLATKMGILKPLAAATFAAAGAGTLTGDYDWRYTYFNNATGSEGNPSDEAAQITLSSNQANIDVVATTQDNPAQFNIRIYRRGGTLPDAWRRVAELTNVTQTYTDNLSDTDIAAADILELDNDVPVTSVDIVTAVTLTDATAVPLPYLWGPANETLFGCGDPNRPDAVYFSKKGKPEAWPAANYVSLDSPGDKAVNGLVYDTKSYVFTDTQLYMLIPDLVGGTANWTLWRTPCGRGAVGPFAFCVGELIYFCSEDGVYQTDGGISTKISDAIRPLFPYAGEEATGVYGPSGEVIYNPIGFGPSGITRSIGDLKNVRMLYHNREVYLFYEDAFGNRNLVIYNVERNEWRFAATNTFIGGYGDLAPPQGDLILLALNGTTYRSQAGALGADPVVSLAQTGGHDQGFPRADKEYGDAAMWVNCEGGNVTVSTFVNSSNVPSNVTVLSGSGLQRYIIPLAGLYGRHIAFRLEWQTTDTSRPQLYWIESAYLLHPEEIKDRQTDWDDLGHPADKLVKGMLLTADTLGNQVQFQVLYDGSNVGATFTIGPDTSGRPRVYNSSWPSFRGRKVRLLPISNVEWKFYGINRWLFDPEPESIAWHEVYWGDGGHAHDKLVKGVTIEADCGGQERTLRVFDDQGNLQETITIGPGVSGIPAIYERSWSSFRTRNIRLIEGV